MVTSSYPRGCGAGHNLNVSGGRLKHFLANIVFLSLFSAVALGIGFGALYSTGLAGPQPANPPVPDIPTDKPLTILVRGWLWDPSSRRVTSPLVVFPSSVNDILRKEYGLETVYYQFDWTRIPKDVFGATDEFAVFAKRVGERAARAGVCVNFVGHSAGAMMVYRAAADGVQMGYMGTLGLPTFGAAKPPSVTMWVDFYTDSHIDDLAGWMWGSHIGSDLNVDLKIPHRDFWGAPEVQRASAAGIALAWATCRPAT